MVTTCTCRRHPSGCASCCSTRSPSGAAARSGCSPPRRPSRGAATSSRSRAPRAACSSSARARPGLPLWTAPVGRFGWRLGSSLRLAGFLRRERIECVIGNVGRDLRLGVLACAMSGAKLLQRRGILRPVPRDPWSRWLYGSRVRRVIVDSEALRQHIVASAPYLGDRVVLLPNAIDTSKPLGGDGARLRAELGIAPDAPLVGAVGRLAPMKGFDHLLRAWPLVIEQQPRARLVVFGGGELESVLTRGGRPPRRRELRHPRRLPPRPGEPARGARRLRAAVGEGRDREQRRARGHGARQAGGGDRLCRRHRGAGEGARRRARGAGGGRARARRGARGAARRTAGRARGWGARRGRRSSRSIRSSGRWGCWRGCCGRCGRRPSEREPAS